MKITPTGYSASQYGKAADQLNRENQEIYDLNQKVSREEQEIKQWVVGLEQSGTTPEECLEQKRAEYAALDAENQDIPVSPPVPDMDNLSKPDDEIQSTLEEIQKAHVVQKSESEKEPGEDLKTFGEDNSEDGNIRELSSDNNNVDAVPIHTAVYGGVNKVIQKLFPNTQENDLLKGETDFNEDIPKESNFSEAGNNDYTDQSNIRILPSKILPMENINQLSPFVQHILESGQGNLEGDSAKLKNSMEEEFSVHAPKGYAAHHLIPSALKDIEILKWAESAGFDINNAGNGIFLPHAGEQGREISQKTGEAYHTKNIAEYTNYVKANLELIQNIFTELHTQQGNGRTMQDFLKESGHDKTLLYNIVNLQNQLRAQLITSDVQNSLLISGSDPRHTSEKIISARKRINKNSYFIGSLDGLAAVANKLRAPRR